MYARTCNLDSLNVNVLLGLDGVLARYLLLRSFGIVDHRRGSKRTSGREHSKSKGGGCADSPTAMEILKMRLAFGYERRMVLRARCSLQAGGDDKSIGGKKKLEARAYTFMRRHGWKLKMMVCSRHIEF